MNLDLMEFLVEMIYLVIIIIIIIINGAYVINLREYRNIGTHWVALYVNNKTIIYFICSELNIFQKKL